MNRTIMNFSALAGLGVLLLAATPARAGINWDAVSGKEVVLFYPGQSSYEWALTGSSMSGADDFRKGKDCATCHVGEEKDMGPQIVTGKPRVFKSGEKPSIEPAPIANKPGSIAATVKTANDGTNIYVHVDFNEGAQPNAGQAKEFATTVSVMFNNGKVSEANRAGCWAACHEDSAGMPAANGADRSMYLPKTRAKITRQGGGDTLAAPDKIAGLKADGYQLEFWQAELNPGQPAKAATQIVFDKQEEVKNVVTAQATQKGGVWSVTISRPLNPGAPFTAIAPGNNYFVALAIHAGHTAERFHYVSFERSLTLNSGAADLIAVKQ